ncbi:MAG: response regulator [Deltaproteobacteria bacterium]|nr:response regulator [Deltaproteobacteria bacterium]
MTETGKRKFDRLLLIDDEPGIRKMMSLDLAADGYQVLTAEDGMSGLDLFEREWPDIVLTDIKMPGIDGLEVLQTIKELSPETEVIVITGHGDMKTAIQALQLGASDFVTKPISDEALAVALKRARERLGLRAELAEYTQDLEKKVSEATAKLLEAERLAAIGQTVASVAHSVKNVLAGLRGGVFMVKEGLKQDDPTIRDQGVNMLERNMRQIKSFVTDLLTISKPREPEMSPLEPYALAAEAVEVMSLEAEAKVVELVLGDRKGEVSVNGERRLLLDAMVNLVSNAIDAAAEVVSGRVEAGVRANGEEVFFEVKDNGPGLSEEARAHIFQGFYSSKGGAGTGLGLMVANKTAREHGGRVEFESQPGKGATFRLVLPLHQEDGPGQAGLKRT